MNEKSWRSLTIGAMVVCAGVLVFHLVVPRQKLASHMAKRQADQLKLMKDVDLLREQVTKLREVNGRHLSVGDADKVSADAMAQVSALARKSNLKLIAFRPQRQQIEGDLARNGYLAALEGPYPNVVSFVNSIEKGSTKLAVQSFQVASADGASDKVSSSVTVVAYTEAAEASK